MLTPDYFYGKSDKLVEMYQELEDWIINDIAMRLIKSGEMSGTADRGLWKLKQMGLHNEEIAKRISQVMGKSRDEVKRLLRGSVMTSFSDDAEVLERLGSIQTPLQNNSVIRAMNAEMQKTFGELKNLTRTTMLQTQKDLLNMLNEVDFRVAAGMQSYSSAVCEVIDRYAQGGVVIDYPTGARRSLEAAVRCCIVTSMNQTAAQVTNQYIIEGGIGYVLVSAHMGARHSKDFPNGIQSHDHWQGKVYKIRGADEDAPNLLESTGYDIDPQTGQGHVVDPLGLHGYNCRHSHKPWDKSLRNPYLDADGNPKIDIHESQELYEKQQRQRVLERNIRQTKRELLAKKAEIDGIAETDVRELLQPQYDKLAYKLRIQNEKYQQYCSDNDLQTQADRIKVAGFKKKQAAIANGRATSYANKIQQEDNVPKRNILSNITKLKKISDLKKMAVEINNQLDKICEKDSKWSGNIHVKKIKAMGRKEWNCDVTLSPDADYSTELHELIHARSISYYDDEVYEKFAKIEEGSVELLSELICKKNRIDFVSSYTEEVRHLLRINRRGKIFEDDFDFAKELINVEVPKRLEWLIDKVNKQYKYGIVGDKELYSIYDSISKLTGGYK